MGLKNGLLISHVILIENGRFYFDLVPNRFLIHVLPKHFHRIRYYGFLANGKAGKQIASIRRALDSRIDTSPETKQSIEQNCLCPACGNGTMMTILVLDGYGNVVKEVLPGADTQQDLMAEGYP